MSIRDLSDDELRAIAGTGKPHISTLSDDELRKIAGLSSPAKISSEKFKKSIADSPFNALSSGISQTLLDMLLAPGNLADRAASKAVDVKPNPINYDLIGQTEHPNFAKGGEIAGAFILPQLGIAKAAEALPLLSKSSSGISKVLNSIMGNAGEGAAYATLAAAGNPNSNMREAATSGAEIGAGLTAGAHALKLPASGIGALVNMYKNRLTKKAAAEPSLRRSPEQAGALSAKLGDQPVNIGELVDDKGAQTFYTDVLGNIPFSGVKAQEGQLVNNSVGKANDVINGLKGRSAPEDIPSSLIDAIARKKNEKKKIAGDLYSETWALADKAKVALKNKDNFKKVTEEILHNEKEGLTKGLDDKDIKYIQSLKNQIVNAKELNPSYYRPYNSYTPKEMSLRHAHNIRSNLGDEAATSYGKDDTRAKVFTALKKALDEDMQASISQSNNKSVIDNYRKANQYFGKEYMPYKGLDLNNLIQNKKDENLVIGNLLNSKNKKILEDMPQALKNLITYSKLGKGEKLEGGENFASPGRINQLAQNIQPSTAKRLLTPEQRKQLVELNALASTSKKAELSRNKPPTGYKNMPEAVMAGLAGILGKSAVLTAPIANKFAKVMTSKALRDAYINRSTVDKEQLMKEMFPTLSKANISPLVKALTRAFAIGGNT